MGSCFIPKYINYIFHLKWNFKLVSKSHKIWAKQHRLFLNLSVILFVINLDENARWDKLVDKIYFKNEEDMFVYNLSRNHF